MIRRASIQEVARLAGVSHPTVSRALAGDPRIASATAERVRRAAEQLGYRPNRLAQALKRGQSPIIGILNVAITVPFYALVIRAFEARARAAGLACVVCDSAHDDRGESDALEFLLELPVRGMLLVGDRPREAPTNQLLAQTWRAGTPVATISGAVPGTDVPRVSIDNDRVGYLAACHLLDAGHRRIAYVATGLLDEVSSTGHQLVRRGGYERALREVGIAPDPDLMIRMDEVTRESADEALDRLLGLPEPPTALFASHDTHALAMMGAALARGRRVPGQLAVVGVDNLPVSSLVWPALTSVAQPVEELTALALDALLRPEAAAPLRLVEPRLVVRASSAAPRPPS